MYVYMQTDKWEASKAQPPLACTWRVCKEQECFQSSRNYFIFSNETDKMERGEVVNNLLRRRKATDIL